MASRKGRTIKQVFDELKGLFEAWDNLSAALIGRMTQDVGADVLVNQCWHEARRGKEQIAVLQSVVDTLGATPAAGRQALRDFAELQYGATYDILVETVTFRNLLTDLQTAVDTLIPTNAQGYITANYIKLSDTPPFFNQVTPAQSAPISAALQNIRNQITD